MRNLRTQNEITSSWLGNINTPTVSICCITFNHEDYIEDAIISFLIQRTNFPFEIIIQDDASSDRTTEIIRKYEQLYPKIIKGIYHKENQYSKGYKPSVLALPYCKGEFIAICEGDDYWTFADKIQMQVNILNQYPSIDLCIHSAYRINSVNNEQTLIGVYSHNEYEIIPAEYIIEKVSGQIPTASTMIRSEIAKELCDFMSENSNILVGDIYLHFFGAKRGGAIYINKPMSCYRFNNLGSFTNRFKNNDSLRLHHLESRISSYFTLDKISSYKFSNSFSKSNLIAIKNYLTNPYNSLINKLRIYSKYFSLLSFTYKISLPLFLCMSFALKIYLDFLPGFVKTKIKKLKNYIYL